MSGVAVDAPPPVPDVLVWLLIATIVVGGTFATLLRVEVNDRVMRTGRSDAPVPSTSRGWLGPAYRATRGALGVATCALLVATLIGVGIYLWQI